MQLLFSAPSVPPRPFTRSLALSAAFHCLLIGASVKVAEHFRETGWKAILRGYTVEPIRVMVPERLYYPRQVAKRAAPGKRPATASRQASGPRPSPVRAPLEGPVIIQPQPQPMAVTAALRVAGVLAWTPRLPEPPKRDASAPIVPGRREQTAAAAQTPVPPRLDVPNREQNFSELNIAAAPPVEKPALPVDAGGTTPVEIASESKDGGRSNVLDAFDRDPANLLILGGNPALRNQTFTVPGGTRLGGGEPSGTASNTASEPKTSEPKTKTEEASARPVAGMSTHSAAGPSKAPTPAQAETRTSAGAPQAKAVASIVPPAAAESATAHAVPLSPPPIRRTNPGDGKFDVVILQSSPTENFTDDAAVLTGRPVYSVYLHVGTSRAWVLQFCLVPAMRQAPAADTPVIVLGKAERVEGPYPLSTVVPTPEAAPAANHTLLHGYVGANGKFHDLRPVTEGDLRAQRVLPYLQQWEFRPATRDNQPVDVEILLAIPPNGL